MRKHFSGPDTIILTAANIPGDFSSQLCSVLFTYRYQAMKNRVNPLKVNDLSFLSLSFYTAEVNLFNFVVVVVVV